MFFTQHAIERFRERWAGGLTHGHALRELKVLADTARPLKERSIKGDEQWEVSDGSRMILVVKRTHGGDGDGLVCVTVLPEPEGVDPAVNEEPA